MRSMRKKEAGQKKQEEDKVARDIAGEGRAKDAEGGTAEGTGEDAEEYAGGESG